MSSDHRALAVKLVHRDPELCVLALSGELSRRSAEFVTRTLSKALHDVGRVLVDVSGLRVAWPPAVQVFPSAVSALGGWPAARLVLFGADGRLAETLRTLKGSATVPLAPDQTTARLLLHRRPSIVARRLDLPNELSSPRRARLFVSTACQDWRLDSICDDAVIVASELVENAVVHARTGCRLAIQLDDRGLTIEVCDTGQFTVLHPRPGHGLFMVAELSRAWAVSPTDDGKSVWALLPGAGSADCPRVIRRAAHDVVRAVLTHGPNSADAPAAVQEIIAPLAEQHGAGAVRDLAEELRHALAAITKDRGCRC